jgi:hypothetical protein
MFWQGSPRYQGDLDLLIQRAEAERLQTLSELQPIFRNWQGIKARPAAGFATRLAARLCPVAWSACRWDAVARRRLLRTCIVLSGPGCKSSGRVRHQPGT